MRWISNWIPHFFLKPFFPNGWKIRLEVLVHVLVHVHSLHPRSRGTELFKRLFRTHSYLILIWVVAGSAVPWIFCTDIRSTIVINKGYQINVSKFLDHIRYGVVDLRRRIGSIQQPRRWIPSSSSLSASAFGWGWGNFGGREETKEVLVLYTVTGQTDYTSTYIEVKQSTQIH